MISKRARGRRGKRQRFDSARPSAPRSGAAPLAAGTSLLRPALGPGTPSWFLVNLIALGAVLVFVRRSLPRNRRDSGGPMLSAIGAGNHATIARGGLLAPLPAYLPAPRAAGRL